MTSQNISGGDFDRLMSQWMEADAQVRPPEQLLEAVLDRTRKARRIPRWLVPERLIPVQLTMRFQAIPRLAPILLIIGLLILAAALALVVGSANRVPPPFGPASNGLLAFDTNAAILVANADGTSSRPLVANVRNAASATWSPDGTRIAFWGDGSPDSLYVVDADGSNVRNLSEDLWITTTNPPAWSPDSRSIVFASESGPDRVDERLYLVQGTGGSPALIGGSDWPFGLRPLVASWSPDGGWIAFTGLEAGSDLFGLWLVRPNGEDLHKLPTSEQLELSQPQWAPSAMSPRLVYAAGGSTGTRQDIFVLDIDSGREAPIVASNAIEHWPTWSPDGNRLAWVLDGTPTRLQVADLTNPQVVTTIPAVGINGQLAWSPDGTSVYASDGINGTVTVITVAGPASIVRITHTRGQGLPSWQRLAP
jgi:Tol biopolymer transport system component